MLFKIRLLTENSLDLVSIYSLQCDQPLTFLPKVDSLDFLFGSLGCWFFICIINLYVTLSHTTCVTKPITTFLYFWLLPVTYSLTGCRQSLMEKLTLISRQFKTNPECSSKPFFQPHYRHSLQQAL